MKDKTLLYMTIKEKTNMILKRELDYVLTNKEVRIDPTELHIPLETVAKHYKG